METKLADQIKIQLEKLSLNDSGQVKNVLERHKPELPILPTKAPTSSTQIFTPTKEVHSRSPFKNIMSNNQNSKSPGKFNSKITQSPLAKNKDLKNKKSFRYFVCLDFEATCNGDVVVRDGKTSFRSSRSRGEKWENEIISFPCTIVDIQNQTVVDEFHTFIKPKINPNLTEYCKKLTGIEQSDVDNAPQFHQAIKLFEEHFESHLSLDNTLIVSDSSYDFAGFLRKNCLLAKTKYPNWARQWVNLKKLFVEFYGFKGSDKQLPTLRSMVEMAGLKFSGKLHSGMDDVENMAKLILRMVQDGVSGIKPNEKLDLSNGQIFFKPIDGKNIDAEASKLTKLISGGLEQNLLTKIEGSKDQKTFSSVTKAVPRKVLLKSTDPAKIITSKIFKQETKSETKIVDKIEIDRSLPPGGRKIKLDDNKIENIKVTIDNNVSKPLDKKIIGDLKNFKTYKRIKLLEVAMTLYDKDKILKFNVSSEIKPDVEPSSTQFQTPVLKQLCSVIFTNIMQIDNDLRKIVFNPKHLPYNHLLLITKQSSGWKPPRVEPLKHLKRKQTKFVKNKQTFDPKFSTRQPKGPPTEKCLQDFENFTITKEISNPAIEESKI